VRDAAIGTRESRLKLKAERRYWRGIHEGLALCYRRGKQGSGTWSARLKLADGSYALRALGAADDHGTANGADVLSFAQAQQQALALQEQAKRDQGIITRPATVAEAAEKYLAWFRDHRRSVAETEHSVRVHILPALGERRIASLKAPELREWLDRLAAQPARVRSSRFGKPQSFKAAPKTAEEKRARRATANRIFSVLKAILNRAFQDGLVADDSEWRKVLPFKKADEARIRFLSDAEGIRLVNACQPDLRALVRAALLTGARYGELVGMRAQDVDLRGARIYIAPAKSGRARHVPLNPEGTTLYRDLLAGKTGDALIFARADGAPWKKNYHVRPLAIACRAAKVRPAIAFHELRHTYASHLAQAGVDLLTISKLLGHADTRITSKHYAHLADKTLAAAVTKLPSFSSNRASIVTAIREGRNASRVSRRSAAN
jgi:integrase